jgi:hypothetical protein|mmetsp:Transcript_69555/g.116823  ORF Transcript_69555/g.116823 Transcript_69555/m.116823 type:complete len:96 (-) Transcript_69555:157-444(-)
MLARHAPSFKFSIATVTDAAKHKAPHLWVIHSKQETPPQKGLDRCTSDAFFKPQRQWSTTALLPNERAFAARTMKSKCNTRQQNTSAQWLTTARG